MKFRTKRNPYTILIVDDEKTVIDTLSTVLDIRGFNILEANNGNKALELIRRHKPDLIVLDLMLPGINGLEICSRIKSDKHFANIPVLIITVVTKDSDLPDGFWCKGTGADDFVTKPFDPFSLADKVERLLKIHNE